jgi:hypothetical protein
MHIPRAWAKVSAECRTQDNRELRVAVWGWGPEEGTAKREAASRLERLIERIRRGDPFPDVYAYGSRPLREEILQTFDAEAGDQPKARGSGTSFLSSACAEAHTSCFLGSRCS